MSRGCVSRHTGHASEQSGCGHTKIWRVVLDHALFYNLKLGRHEQLLDLLGAVRARLKEIGFQEKNTDPVWFELLDRYQRGWRMLRSRRSVAEMEAERLREADQ